MNGTETVVMVLKPTLCSMKQSFGINQYGEFMPVLSEYTLFPLSDSNQYCAFIKANGENFEMPFAWLVNRMHSQIWPRNLHRRHLIN